MITAALSLAGAAYKAALGASAQTKEGKAARLAQGFEASFANSMIGHMVAGLDGEGPLGGKGAGAEAWRGFLTEQMAKGVTAKGGLGIAPSAYASMIQVQERANG